MLLDSVSFSIETGEHCAIVGPNGAGKSTLLNLLLGIYRPSNGEVFYNGLPIATQSRREIATKVSYVPQLLAAEIPYSVIDFVAMGRYAHGGGKDDSAVKEALRIVDVERLQDRAVSTLSGGERQRVCIAAALAQGAPLLVLDEPLSHLDPGQRLEIRDVIENLPDTITVLSVTHDMDWLLEGFGRVLCMKDGRLIDDVTVKQFVHAGLADELFGHGLASVVKQRYREHV